jgi:hypothetical protein
MIAINASASPAVDGLVEGITVKLQLTDAQRLLAQHHAAEVAAWLRADGSPLAKYYPEVFPQGSMRHGTTVRPRWGIEYDLDLVCLLHVPITDLISSDELYELVYERLLKHKEYGKILERKNRCVRLSFPGNFHLDVLPAKPDYDRGGTCLLIADRSGCCWKPTNPQGFAAWFDQQAETGTRVKSRYAGIEVTDAMRGQFIATLRRVVQLMKRRRDIVFDGDQYCVRSIVLTTLAAGDYDGQTLCTDALISVLDAIIDAFGHLREPPSILNPTNPDENFADKWTPGTFAEFMAFIRLFKREMEELLELDDLEKIHAQLKAMFGEDVATSVIKEAAQQMRALKDQGKLRFERTAVGLTVAAAATSRAIAGNTFHGD